LRILGAVLLLSLGCSTAPQGESSERLFDRVRALRPPVPDGDLAILDALESRARDTLTSLRRPEDRPSLEKAVPRIRQQLRRSLGLDLLPPPAAKNVRSVGSVTRDGYRIEKLIYESLPSVDVPAHLYLPSNAQGRVPAILFVPGHWFADSKTRPEFQAFAITMARRGFAVLTYDPFGQGERGISVRDHRRTELLAVGVAQEAIVVHESLCALEILLARPEVDPARVGMTGASGGGFNSWIVPALETRIAATVPVVGTADFVEQSRAVRAGDWFGAKEHCHFIPRLFRYANNHELLACVAPRPVMVISAHHDVGFPIPGQRDVVKYGERLYGALGSSGKVGYFEDADEGHGYQKRKREAAYGWFLKWLKDDGDGSAVSEGALEIPAWNASEMRCFPKNQPAGPGLNALAVSILERTALTKEAPRKTIASILGIPDPLPVAAAPDLVRPDVRLSIGPVIPGFQRIGWRTPDGVAIPGALLSPESPARGVLVVVADIPKEWMVHHPAVRRARESGWAIALVDLRGVGELQLTKPGWVYAMSLLLGENFVGRQALDLIAGVRALRAEPAFRDKPVGVLASGPFTTLAALYAAVLEPGAFWLAAEDGYASFREFVQRPASSFALAEPGRERDVQLDLEIPHSVIPFGICRGPDIPDLLSTLGPDRAAWSAASTLKFVRARMEETR
jgi:dienelactone hydrolase